MSGIHGPTCQSDDHHDAEHNAGRRIFMKGATAASVGLLGGMAGLPALALGQPGTKTLVKVFMYGGADSLSLLPMVGDDAYYVARPTVQIAKPSSSDAGSAISLGVGPYALNPNLADLKAIWDDGRMAICPATHFAEGNRSHFDCQKWVAFGSSDISTRDGVFARYLAENSNPGAGQMRAINAGTSNTLFFSGATVPSVRDPASFGDPVGGLRQTLDQYNVIESKTAMNRAETMTRDALRAMYAAIDSVDGFKTYVPNARGRNYSASPLGKGLALVAYLLKRGTPVELACLNWAGLWDTHSTLLDPGHYRGMSSGAADLLTFWLDIEPLRSQVLVMVGSEFGRTVNENGTKGSDHGKGGAWFAFGNAVKRPGIVGGLTTLAGLSSNYLPVGVNYKDMLGEALVKHMGMSEALLSKILPGHTFQSNGIFT